MVVFLVVGSIIVVIALFFVAKMFAGKLIFPNIKSYEECISLTEKNNEVMVNQVDKLNHKDIKLPMSRGYNIIGKLFIQDNAKGVVILSHGITWNMIGSYKYVTLFYNRGYNVFIYDHRNHGKSGGSNTSFGYYEKLDLQEIITYLTNKFGSDFIIGLHGESMGAATVIQIAGIERRIDFVIADCPFSELKTLLLYRMKKDYGYSFPFIFPLVNLYLRVLYGWSIEKSSPIYYAKKIEVPTLYIHGEKDFYVPTNMSRELFEVTRGEKELYISTGAAHAKSYMKNEKEYKEVVNRFLTKYGF